MDEYWFARGYYDGRGYGVSRSGDILIDSHVESYNRGYGVGVTDYVQIDMKDD